MTTIALHTYKHLEPAVDVLTSTQLPETFGRALLHYMTSQMALSERNASPIHIGYVTTNEISGAQTIQDEADLLAIRESLRDIENNPSVVISGDELRNRLSSFLD